MTTDPAERLDPPELWQRGEPAGVLDAFASALGRRQVIDPLFEAVMDASHSGFLIMNARRRILYANRAMAELTGYSVAELLALPTAGVLTPEGDQARARGILEEAFREHRRRVVRRREIVHRDGHLIPVAASAEALVIDGAAVALVIEFADRRDEARALAEIVAQAEALQSVNEELAAFREMVSHARDSILIVQEGQIVSRNGAYRERLGFEGERSGLAEILEPDSLPAALAAIRRIESGERASELLTVKLRDADGELRQFEATLSPIAFRGAPAVLAVARDVTDRIELEQRLRASERLEVLTRVSGGAAHELANALAALTAAITEDAPHELRAAVDRARRLASGLALIGGQGVGRPESVAVESLLGDAVSNLPAEEAARVRVVAGPDASVSGRQDDLVLAIGAYLVNALEAGPGPVELRSSLVLGMPDQAQPGEDEGQGYALIEIADSGRGMTPAVRARVSELFYSSKAGHVGLGAALAEAVVRAHAGATTIESTVGAGTTVRVYLPLTLTAGQPSPAPDAEPAAGGSTVLIVDDNRTLRAVAAAAMRGAGYDVLEAGSVAEARTLLTPPTAVDLLVLDIRLEDGTGLEIFEAAGGPAEGPPALFVSGYSGDELSDLAPSERWQFIAKPFSRQSLLDAIEQLLASAPTPA